MEHYDLIIEPNVTQKIKREYFDWAFYDNNIFELLEVCPNLTYYAKTFKFINMFSKYQKNHITTYESHEIYIPKIHNFFS